MIPQPTGRSLSDQLKQLQYAEPPLDPTSFTVDDVVRGGRRRRQRRTAVQIAAAVAAVAALGTGIVLPQLHGNGNDAPPAVPTISSAPALPRIDLADKKVTFTQKGATATAKKSGKVVATLTLTSATWGTKSSQFVFSIDAMQPVRIDTAGFTLYAGGAENSMDSERKINLPAGKSTFTLDFKDVHDYMSNPTEPEAIGWFPANGDALWER